MSRAAVAEDVRRGLAADFPKRDVEAIYSRFLRWAERREVHSPERALRTWVENAERDDAHRLDAGGRPANDYQPAPLGERSDPTYAAFRFGVLKLIQTQDLGPLDVANILAENHAKFADLTDVGDLLDREIALYRTMTDNRWRRVNLAKWEIEADTPAGGKGATP